MLKKIIVAGIIGTAVVTSGLCSLIGDVVRRRNYNEGWRDGYACSSALREIADALKNSKTEQSKSE